MAVRHVPSHLAAALGCVIRDLSNVPKNINNIATALCQHVNCWGDNVVNEQPLANHCVTFNKGAQNS